MRSYLQMTLAVLVLTAAAWVFPDSSEAGSRCGTCVRQATKVRCHARHGREVHKVRSGACARCG